MNKEVEKQKRAHTRGNEILNDPFRIQKIKDKRSRIQERKPGLETRSHFMNEQYNSCLFKKKFIKTAITSGIDRSQILQRRKVILLSFRAMERNGSPELLELPLPLGSAETWTTDVATKPFSTWIFVVKQTASARLITTRSLPVGYPLILPRPRSQQDQEKEERKEVKNKEKNTCY